MPRTLFESKLPIHLSINCGEHGRDLDMSRPIALQVHDIFADVRIQILPGVIKAAFAIVNGMVVIYDGYTIGVLCDYRDNEGDLPDYIAGVATNYNALRVSGRDMDLDKVRRFYVAGTGQIVFRA